MAPFYFFSPFHEEKFESRDYEDNFTLTIPNSTHNIKLDKSKWEQLPYKFIYHNTTYVYSKPLLVIANRYNTEWGRGAISYFDIETLDFLISKLEKHYQIVYNRPSSDDIANDNSKVMELGDFSLIENKFPNVILMQALYTQERQNVSNYNHLQLLVYANCENFISIHGGTATLASCFGGKNLIYSVEGHEHPLNEFQNVFSELSGAEIYVAQNVNDLKNHAIQLFGTN